MLNKTHAPPSGLRAPRALLPRCSNRLRKVHAAMSPSSSPSPEDSDANSRRNEPKAVALDPSDPTSQLVAKAMYKEDLTDNAAVQLHRRPVLGLLGLGGVAGAAGLWTIKSEQQRSTALLRYSDEASMPLATALALTLDAAGYMSTVRAQLMTMVRQMRAGFRTDSSFSEEGVSSQPLERLLLADALILHLSNLEQALPVLGAQAAYGQPDASIFSLNIGDAPRDRQCERLTVEGLYLLRRAKSVLLSMRKAQTATLSETRDFVNALTPAMKNVDELLGYLPPVQP